jgi:DNA ligase 1
MRRWSEIAAQVAATTKTSEKTAILAAYLAALDPEELPIAAVFLTGRPFPERDGRTTGIGWSTLGQVVLRVAGADEGALRRAYDRSSDVSVAVGEVLSEAGHTPDPAGEPTLTEVAAAFAAIQSASGPAAKGEVLAALLRRSSPGTAAAIVKVLSGELRIGLREGLLEAAVAKAFDRPLAAVKRAGMLTGDVGRTALLALEDHLDAAALALFSPLKFMLASPAEDAAEIMARLGPTVWVEDKYDGIRCQLHRAGDEVRCYSRDLNDITGQFPEVAEAARSLPWAGILDGEILAWKDGTVLPFLALQARLGRKAPSAAIRAEIPVIYVAYDVLALAEAGRDAPVASLLDEPSPPAAHAWRGWRSRSPQTPRPADSR